MARVKAQGQEQVWVHVGGLQLEWVEEQEQVRSSFLDHVASKKLMMKLWRRLLVYCPVGAHPRICKNLMRTITNNGRRMCMNFGVGNAKN